jgi:bifunctional pyridoxal-dependent enzyme with beta-cystathionase and maltose regulon repressor activities
MTKEKIISQIDKLIERIKDTNNSVHILQPLVQDVYRQITKNNTFLIEDHLHASLKVGKQYGRRRLMIQLLEGIKEQIDLFVDDKHENSDERNKIGF